MTLIEMIDEIDRLVSNHGTISQIKPIIIPLREQVEAFEARVRTLESKSKVKRLEGENDFLRSQLDTTLKQIHEAEDGKQSSHSSDSADGGVQLLLMLSTVPHNQDGPSVEDIAATVNMSVQVVQFHLDELQKKELVYAAYNMYDVTRWYLGTEGRAHLFKLGLLK